MQKAIKGAFPAKTYKSLRDILMDHELASLGDAFINFTYSLFLSVKKGRPVGAKVKGAFLAEAIRRSGLRDKIGSRMSSHDLADGAEALVVYAWLHRCITLEESVEVLRKSDDPVEGLNELLRKIVHRIRLS